MNKSLSFNSKACYSFAAAVVAAGLTIAMAGCEKEIYSERPEYGTLFFSADSIEWRGEIHPVYSFSPGQTVYVGVPIEREGAYITRATQQWTLRGMGTNAIKTETVTVVGPVGHEPVWHFAAPMEEGEYSVTFKEKYSYSAGQPNGTIFGESATLNSKFRVR